MLGSASSVRAHGSEAVSIVDEDAERVFFLESCNLVKDAECACHAEHAFGDQQHTAALLVGNLAGIAKNTLTIDDVVVAELEALAEMQTDTVAQTSMRFRVIDNDIASANQRVDGGHNALIAEVELESSFLMLEVGQLPLQLFVESGLTGHHTAAHRIGHTPAGGAFRVGLAHLGMVGQTEVVVEAPAKHLLAVETHVRTQLAFQLRECEIAVNFLAVLPDRTTG